MPQDSCVGQHDHPIGSAGFDPGAPEEVTHSVLEGGQSWLAGQMVLGPDLGPGLKPAWQRRRGVNVDQPLVMGVIEGMLDRQMPHMADSPDHKGGQSRQIRDLHQVTPKASAASTPDRAPSSWKPQPQCAPAYAVLAVVIS